MTLLESIISPDEYTKRDLTYVVRRQLRHTPVKFFYVARL